jgi:hypothetical protein
MASMQECIKNCLDCHAVCLETISHCLAKGGDHTAPEHIRILQDCAQICITNADFMLRRSPLHQMTCRICSGICEMSAEDCTRLADDEAMVLCIEMCRRCAASCAEMSAVERKAA